MTCFRRTWLIIGLAAFFLMHEVKAACGPKLADAEKLKEAYKKLIDGGKKENDKCDLVPIHLIYQLGYYAGKTPEKIKEAFANSTSPTPQYELSLEAEMIEGFVGKIKKLCSMKKELLCDDKTKKCKKCKDVRDKRCRVLRDIKNSANAELIGALGTLVPIFGCSFLILFS